MPWPKRVPTTKRSGARFRWLCHGNGHEVVYELIHKDGSTTTSRDPERLKPFRKPGDQLVCVVMKNLYILKETVL